MELDPKLEKELQNMLSGMRAGFTLTPDRLHIRTGVYEFGYILASVYDNSIKRCDCCENEILGNIYEGTEIIKVRGRELYKRNLSLCYECACPQ